MSSWETEITETAIRDEVKALARAVERECRERFTDDVHDVAWEMLDGHRWTIYSRAAHLVTIHSDHSSEGWDELREWAETLPETSGALVAQWAFACLMVAVREEVDLSTYRAAIWTSDDGKSDLVLTGPHQAHLPPFALLAAARREAAAAGFDLSGGYLDIGEWQS